MISQYFTRWILSVLFPTPDNYKANSSLFDSVGALVIGLSNTAHGSP